jgi:thiamine-monophosphate kinase
VKRINEHETIRIILEAIGQPRVPYSMIGDDVALIPPRDGDLIAKVDMLVRKTDAPKGMATWQMARKSVVASVSDFAAKGVQPSAALLSLALPAGITRKEVQELGRGFRKARDEFGIQIVGGDTNESDDIVIDCCLLGFAEWITGRHGAAPGDRIVVSGPFGYPPVGLKILQDGVVVQESFREMAIASVLLPKPKLDLGIVMTTEGLLSSSIDSSDGLALSLHQLAESGEIGFNISKLPIEGRFAEFAEKSRLEIDEIVLYGGEEYEIVATIPEDKIKQANLMAERLGHHLIEIGSVTEEAGTVLFDDGIRRFQIEKRGWVHLG